jgi:hypothetical protein
MNMNHGPVEEVFDDPSVFEPIRRQQRPRFPVATDRSRRAAKETRGSRRVRREISQSLGGMHRRRHRKLP